MAKKSKAQNRAETALTVVDATKLMQMMPGGGKGITFGGKKYSAAKVVTVPHLKHEEGSIVGIRILDKIYTGKEIKAAKGEQQREKPAQLCHVANLEDDIEYTYIVAAVVESNLNETYPKDSYVGKEFAIMKGPKMPGKRYHQYAITELK